MIRSACLLTLMFLVTPLAHAAPVNYAIASDKTAIDLSWFAFGNRFSQAHLQGVSGDIRLDPAEDRDDTIRVSVPVATLVASNALLTWQLKSDLFFDAQRYPTISFVSSRVVSLGQGKFRIFGMLSVKAVSRPVMMLASLDDGQTLWPGSQTLTLHATTAISRAAFGVDRLASVVDDRVDIALTLAARAKQPL